MTYNTKLFINNFIQIRLSKTVLLIAALLTLSMHVYATTVYLKANASGENDSPICANAYTDFYNKVNVRTSSVLVLVNHLHIQGDKIKLTADKNSPILMADADNILYVNKHVVGGNGKGDSWANAVPELADAMAWAKQTENLRTAANPLQIFIAKGTYKPLYSAADGFNTTFGGRDNAFVLSKDMSVYGGFDPANGISSLINQRIFGANGTILSGDIGVEDNNADNAYHVVISAGNLGAALLSGVVVEEGKAEGGGGIKIVVNGENIYRNSGAGFYNNGANIILQHVLIRNNYSDGHGAGVYNDGSSVNKQPTHLLVTNSEISNSSGAGEASFTCSGATAVYMNTNFIENAGGAAQDSNNSTTNIFNSIWYNNGSSTPSCTNSTKIGSVKYSIIVSLVPSSELTHVREEPTNNVFNSTDIGANDLFVLTAAHPGIDKGSNVHYATHGGSLTGDKDLANKSRISNGGTIDIGAFEYQGSSATLPVKLLNYSVKIDGNYSKLKWQTANEINNKGFEICRSSDDGEFIKIAEIKASSSQTYSFTDYEPSLGNNYYKLVQIDIDGAKTELGVRALIFSLYPLTYQVYPNPAKAKIFLNRSLNTNYQLYDNLGKRLGSGNTSQVRSGLDVSHLSKGIYFILIEGKAHKFIKE